ncbi:MAG: type IV toxin-antitoxin system AbiEi family antitoxin [Candidatus Eisenbacteria bacterium]
MRRWIQRVRRGVFLVLPLEANTAARPTADDPWVLASALFVPSYVGGWSAAEHWGLTEQIFRSTFVATSARLRTTDIHLKGMEFHVVRVQPRRVESVPHVWRGSERVRVSGPERTLADVLATPSWLGGIRTVVDAIQEYRRSDHWNPDRLLEELGVVGIGSAYKRLGFIAEALDLADEGFLRSVWEGQTSGLAKLDPDIRTRGRLSKRWNVWVNASVDHKDAT